MPKLAQTTFTSGVDKSLAVIDVYEEDAINPINDVADTFSLNDTINGLKSVLPTNVSQLSQTVKSVASEVNSGVSQLSQTTTSMVNGVKSLGGEALSALKSLSSEMQSNLTSAKGAISAVTSTVNNITSVVKNAPANAVSAITTITKSLSGDIGNIASVVDNSFKVTLGTNLIQQASEIGVGGIYTELANGPLTKDLIPGITSNIAPLVAMKPDLDLINEITTNPIGAATLTNTSPNLAKDILKNYKEAKQIVAGVVTAKKEIKAQAQQLKSTLNQIDKSWNQLGKSIDTSLDTLLTANPIKAASDASKAAFKYMSNEQATIALLNVAASTTDKLIAQYDKPVEMNADMILFNSATQTPNVETELAIKQDMPYLAIA